jgi:hypothetical protein
MDYGSRQFDKEKEKENDEAELIPKVFSHLLSSK